MALCEIQPKAANACDNEAYCTATFCTLECIKNGCPLHYCNVSTDQIELPWLHQGLFKQGLCSVSAAREGSLEAGENKNFFILSNYIIDDVKERFQL